MGIPQEEIEAATPWLRNLLGIIRGRVYYNINNWYKGLTVLPSFGQNKEDMEDDGSKDRHFEDMNLTFFGKARLLKTPSMLKDSETPRHLLQEDFEERPNER